MLLPRASARDGQSFAAEQNYRAQVEAFCRLILPQINSSLSARAIGATCSKTTDCARATSMPRRSSSTTVASRGDLPLDICCEDLTRETVGLEQLDRNDVPAHVEAWINYLRNHAHESYTPISFGDDLDIYVEVGSRSSTCATCSRRCARSFTSRSPISRAGVISTGARG